MEAVLQWLPPFDLQDGAGQYLIYQCNQLNAIPAEPGVYVFFRSWGDTIDALYIGRSDNLRNRIGQHLEGNTQLMMRIRDPVVGTGARGVLVAALSNCTGPRSRDPLPVIEAALIEAALAEDHALFNVQGTRTRVHTIRSQGNGLRRGIFPSDTVLARR